VGRQEIPDAMDPASYRFWVTEHIRFADLDLLGHVNNVAFTVYAESCRDTQHLKMVVAEAQQIVTETLRSS
jgi:acyl-CoA thioester hydrolase